MCMFLAVFTVLSLFYGFSAFVTSRMSNRSKLLFTFRTDHPSLILQNFLTDRTASRVKNIKNFSQQSLYSCFLLLFFFQFLLFSFYLFSLPFLFREVSFTFILHSVTQLYNALIQRTVSLLLFLIADHLCKGFLISHHSYTFSCSGNSSIKEISV